MPHSTELLLFCFSSFYEWRYRLINIKYSLSDVWNFKFNLPLIEKYSKEMTRTKKGLAPPDPPKDQVCNSGLYKMSNLLFWIIYFLPTYFIFPFSPLNNYIVLIFAYCAMLLFVLLFKFLFTISQSTSCLL